MSVDLFIPFVPGAVDDIGRRHDLRWGARSMLRWLVENADRQTGQLNHITVGAIEAETRCAWRAVRRSLAELERAGLIKTDLPRGHSGTIYVLCHGEVVYVRYGQKTNGTGRKTSRSGRSTGTNGQKTNGTGTSTGANRGNAPQKSEKNSLSDDASSRRSSSSESADAHADAFTPCDLPEGILCLSDGRHYDEHTNTTTDKCPQMAAV